MCFIYSKKDLVKLSKNTLATWEPEFNFTEFSIIIPNLTESRGALKADSLNANYLDYPQSLVKLCVSVIPCESYFFNISFFSF